MSVSMDGSCGGSTGFICLGSTFGDCCSEKGYCGGNSSYCTTGCQSDFGKCGFTNGTAQISTDGSCGGESGTTCLGSEFGGCCSPKGYCGGNASYCDAGCQTSFGTCSLTPSSTNTAASSSSTQAPPSVTAVAAATSSPVTTPPIPTVQTVAFKAGIAVASVVAFLALLALAFLLFRRQRQRQQRHALFPPKVADPNAVEAPSGSEVSTRQGSHHENVYPSELSTVRYRQELPADEKLSLGARIEERRV